MAGNVISLENAIYKLLKMCHSRVYLEDVPDADPDTLEPPQLPYLVYSLPDSITQGFREDFSLEVNGWDENTDTTPLEVIMDTVDKVLHGYNHYEENVLAAIIKREGRHRVPDTDPNIIRRQNIYVVKTYFSEGGTD